jgi:hypothetical protein
MQKEQEFVLGSSFTGRESTLTNRGPSSEIVLAPRSRMAVAVSAARTIEVHR